MSEKTELINMKNYDNKCPEDAIRIDRGSKFGNPFKINKHGDKKEVVSKYYNYFHKKIEEDEEFKKAVEELKGETLACWCAPKRCHGDVIIEYLEGVED